VLYSCSFVNITVSRITVISLGAVATFECYYQQGYATTATANASVHKDAVLSSVLVVLALQSCTVHYKGGALCQMGITLRIACMHV
jgi:hypothetical protein